MENMNERTNGDHIVAQALETALGNKVEKEDGKGLSSNDYTDAEKEKLAGIPVLDYTSLEEQIVPGEFWLGTDGVKRQVYIRTFMGTIPLDFSNLPAYEDFKFRHLVISEELDYLEIAVLKASVGITLPCSKLANMWYTLGVTRVSELVLILDDVSFLKGKPYSITLKYTKA